MDYTKRPFKPLALEKDAITRRVKSRWYIQDTPPDVDYILKTIGKF